MLDVLTAENQQLRSNGDLRSNPTKPVTATVSGVLITANISGLKKGTTYYVKCVATGKGGTTTTGTTKVITNY